MLHSYHLLLNDKINRKDKLRIILNHRVIENLQF